MARRAEPKGNIEYTFRFRKGDRTHLTVLIYEGMNEKGRCVFFNKSSKSHTSMTLKRFGYIHRFNLISENQIQKQPIQKEPSPIELERQKARQKRLEEIERERKQQKEIKEYIEQLQSLNNAQKEEVESAVQRRVEDIILDLNGGAWTSITSIEWYKVQQIIRNNGVA